MIDFDYILTKIGKIGLYQILVISMIYYYGIPCGLNTLLPVFTNYIPYYRCKVPPFDNEHSGLNETQILAITTPLDENGEYDTCRRYDYNATECHKHGNISYDCLENINETIPCTEGDGYYYDRSLFTETVVTEMDLVCEKIIYSYVSTSLYMVGLLLGSFIFGNFADRYGRKPSIIITCIGSAIGLILAALSHVYWLYTFSRVFNAVFGYGLYMINFVLVVELVGPEWRTLVGIGYQFFYAIGVLTLSGVAYGWRDWHQMQWGLIIISVPFVCFLFLIPESPRWLFGVERNEAAKKITSRIEKFSKIDITEEMWLEAERLGTEIKGRDRKQEEENRKYSSLDLFRKPGIRLTTLKVMFTWFVNSLVYYGLSLNISSLSGNIFINNVIGGCMEIISYVICILAMDVIGRRLLLAIMLLSSGITLIISTIVNLYAGDDQSLITLGVVFTFLGRLGISGSYALVYNFTLELFPTVVRSNGIGISSCAARISGVIAPLLIATQIWFPWLPNSIFGIFGIIGGFISLTLPETNGMKMLVTLEEAEFFYKQKQSTKEKNGRLPSEDLDNSIAFQNKSFEAELTKL
ncbi:organic cation transporter protein-like [Styela clava]